MRNNFIFTQNNNCEYPIYTSACVGNNGNPNILDYAEGFASAANHLIEISLKCLGEFPPDIAVYPICFNMRHSVELYLKGYISFVEELATIKKIKIGLTVDIMKTHDINKIWKYLTTSHTQLDKRLINMDNQISPYIECFGDIDVTGQTFRYPYDNENNKHLTKQSIINIMHLGKNFKELKEKLNIFYYFHEHIIEEYKTRSFTKNLSRYDLKNIAQELPQYYLWKKPETSFDAKFNDLTQKYQISRNELSKAINIIKNHYEFGYFIGIVPPLIDFSEDEFYFFIDKWYQVNNLDYIYNNSDSFIIDSIDLADKNEENIKNVSSKLKEGLEKKVKIGEISNELVNSVKVGTIINIHALYYFSSDCNYSEEYSQSYLYHEKDCKQDMKKSINHMLHKTILLPELVISLLRLSQKKIAFNLMEKYALKNYIKKQLESRKINIPIILE
jgi:hypothetical protein